MDFTIAHHIIELAFLLLYTTGHDPGFSCEFFHSPEFRLDTDGILTTPGQFDGPSICLKPSDS
jgi:hypothetical protein